VEVFLPGAAERLFRDPLFEDAIELLTDASSLSSPPRLAADSGAAR
jgi:hypothetical protein